jgi:hypothetical protein
LAIIYKLFGKKRSRVRESTEINWISY